MKTALSILGMLFLVLLSAFVLVLTVLMTATAIQDRRNWKLYNDTLYGGVIKEKEE